VMQWMCPFHGRANTGVISRNGGWTRRTPSPTLLGKQVPLLPVAV
jgi:hypothetical protein